MSTITEAFVVRLTPLRALISCQMEFEDDDTPSVEDDREINIVLSRLGWLNCWYLLHIRSSSSFHVCVGASMVADESKCTFIHPWPSNTHICTNRNPLDPDVMYRLELDNRDQSIVAACLVDLAVKEPDENWVNLSHFVRL